MPGVAETFKEFPIRQLGLSGDVGKTIEGIRGTDPEDQARQLSRGAER